MQLLIYGPGRLGGAIAAAAVSAGWPTPVLIGRAGPDGTAGRGAPRRRRGRRIRRRIDRGERRPRARRREPRRSSSPRPAGRRTCRSSARCSWSTGRRRSSRPTSRWARRCSAGSWRPPRSWYALAGGFEPSIVEWHRSGKADRPSGTARALARRIAGVDARWALPGEPDRADDDRRVLEVAGIRAGAAPGTHLVTFDGTGESVELRLDRPRSIRLRRRGARRRPLAHRRAARARPPPVRRRRRRPPGARRHPA